MIVTIDVEKTRKIIHARFAKRILDAFNECQKFTYPDGSFEKTPLLDDDNAGSLLCLLTDDCLDFIKRTEENLINDSQVATETKRQVGVTVGESPEQISRKLVIDWINCSTQEIMEDAEMSLARLEFMICDAIKGYAP